MKERWESAWVGESLYVCVQLKRRKEGRQEREWVGGRVEKE
jgi:hypothetical protein